MKTNKTIREKCYPHNFIEVGGNCTNCGISSVTTTDNKTIREEFEEKFELERQGCSECGGFELVDKTEIRYPQGKYHCEYDLDKVISFIEKTLLAQVEEIEDMVEGRKVPPPTKNDDSIYPIVVDAQNKLINDLLSALKEKKDKLEKEV